MSQMIPILFWSTSPLTVFKFILLNRFLSSPFLYSPFYSSPLLSFAILPSHLLSPLLSSQLMYSHLILSSSTKVIVYLITCIVTVCGNSLIICIMSSFPTVTFSSVPRTCIWININITKQWMINQKYLHGKI